ncbi:MAG: TetR/AcrR family transcriptional regulator [Spirochaetota bacterium]
MKGHSVFTTQHIIEAAFALTRTHGWEHVTARSIAKEIGSSTMPIYSHVNSLQDLEKHIRELALQLLQTYQQDEQTEDPLLNLAVGYVTFAREEKPLFRFLFLDNPGTDGNTKAAELFFSQFGADSPASQLIKTMPKAIYEPLIENARIYTHGLAMLVYAEIITPPGENEIRNLLKGAGEAFYLLSTQKEM